MISSRKFPRILISAYLLAQGICAATRGKPKQISGRTRRGRGRVMVRGRQKKRELCEGAGKTGKERTMREGVGKVRGSPQRGEQDISISLNHKGAGYALAFKAQMRPHISCPKKVKNSDFFSSIPPHIRFSIRIDTRHGSPLKGDDKGAGYTKKTGAKTNVCARFY